MTGDDVEGHGGLHADGARPVGDPGAVERELRAVRALDRAQAAPLVEGHDPPGHQLIHCVVHSTVHALRQWTIFAIGSSMMSDAPASLSAGISVLISDLAT